jgi:hypothetical protein
MFHEYALDPSVLSNWERTRYFLDAFGPWRGRLLAEYPRRWKRLVYEQLQCPDLERKRIEERLAVLDRRVFSGRSGAPFDPLDTWLDNAVRENGRLPFRAIVSNERRAPNVLDANALDDREALWRVDSGRRIPRAAAEFVKAVQILLDASTRVILVDPYFRADQPDKTGPVVAFCSALAGRQVRLEVHFRDEPWSYDWAVQQAERYLPGLLPLGIRLELRCWKERLGGERLHNRYLLTDVGGVQFGDGIEVGNAGQHDRMSILDEPSWSSLWSHYASEAPAFDEAGAVRYVESRHRPPAQGHS